MTHIPASIANIANAEQLNSGGPNFIGKHGLYVADISEVKIIASQSENTDFYIVETEIVESTHPEVMVGTKCSHLIKLGDKGGPPDAQAVSLSMVEGLMKKAGQYDQHVATKGPLSKEIFAGAEGQQLLMHLTGDAQPCKGLRFKLNVWNKHNAKNGKDFTKVDFEYLAPGATLGLVSQAPAQAPVSSPAAPAPATPSNLAGLLGA